MIANSELYKDFYEYIEENKLDLLVKLTLNKFNFFDYIEMKKKYQLNHDLLFNSNYEYTLDLMIELLTSSHTKKTREYSGCLCVYLNDTKCEISYKNCDDVFKFNYKQHYKNKVSVNINDIRKKKLNNLL